MRNISLYLLKLYGLDKLEAEMEYELHVKTNPILPDDYENVYYINIQESNSLRYTYIISDEGRIRRLCESLNGKIKYEAKNITIEIIDNKEFDGSELVENKKFFDDFRFQFLTPDDILEKISRCGTDSLDDIDKKILNDTNRKTADYRIEPIFESDYLYYEDHEDEDDIEGFEPPIDE